MTKAKRTIDEATDYEVESSYIEGILDSIRCVISGEYPQNRNDDSDILELTDLIEEDNDATRDEESYEKSILDDIDAALEADGIDETSSAPNIEEDSMSLNNNQRILETAEMLYSASTNDNRTKSSEEWLEIDATETFTTDTSAKPAHSSGILDENAARLSSVSLKEFVSTINNKQVNSPHTRSGTSLEDLVIEAMKPFLADWLNKNLPVIVKKVVEKEVKRLIPKDDED